MTIEQDDKDQERGYQTVVKNWLQKWKGLLLPESCVADLSLRIGQTLRFTKEKRPRGRPPGSKTKYNTIVTEQSTNIEKSLTINEWCAIQNYSRATFYKLRKRGLVPDVMYVPGTQIARITPTANHEWYAKMVTLAQGEAAQREEQRRHDRAVRAGKIAAKSPIHISRSNMKGTRHAKNHQS